MLLDDWHLTQDVDDFLARAGDFPGEQSGPLPPAAIPRHRLPDAGPRGRRSASRKHLLVGFVVADPAPAALSVPGRTVGATTCDGEGGVCWQMSSGTETSGFSWT